MGEQKLKQNTGTGNEMVHERVMAARVRKTVVFLFPAELARLSAVFQVNAVRGSWQRCLHFIFFVLAREFFLGMGWVRPERAASRRPRA